MLSFVLSRLILKKCKVLILSGCYSFFVRAFHGSGDIDTQPDKHFIDDPTVNHSVVINSSVWVIGPYIPEDEDGNASKIGCITILQLLLLLE